MNEPLFTVATVVYNSESTIEETLLSCLNQTYKNVEYIVVDGNSSDLTTEIVSKYKQNITKFVCEPDFGIYDAMNKAIDIASGQWIIFMNSGDLFFDEFVLSRVAQFIMLQESTTDIIYGNTVYKFKNNLLEVSPMPLNRIEREMIFCHQSAFVRTDLVKSQHFDLNFRLAADYNMFYQFYKQRKIFKYIDSFISIFNQQDGSTLKNFKLSTKERYSIHSDFGTVKNFLHLNKTILKIQLSLIKSKFFPVSLNQFIFKIKYKGRVRSK